ncbi:RNA-binding domain-containing protein [Candidatus Methanocrinis alkalitolerans]|uniref:RNA-binding domain-containing protein n=1 Tax=Candidatus Methanocrinis alkalitolerans TaxID=3033395 RepID=UPI002934C950|nr:RNA-binding domain-containing protein [Candidatus Methanocrinis alkalitolerans]
MIHRVTFRAFVASTEDDGKVREALSLFVPKGSVSKTSAVGHFGNEIIILSATLGKKEGLRFFLLLREALPEGDMARLRREAAQRVDDDCKLYLRLDKQAACEGEVRLADCGDAISVSAHLESYPARRDRALKVAEDLL